MCGVLSAAPDHAGCAQAQQTGQGKGERSAHRVVCCGVLSGKHEVRVGGGVVGFLCASRALVLCVPVAWRAARFARTIRSTAQHVARLMCTALLACVTGFMHESA